MADKPELRHLPTKTESLSISETRFGLITRGYKDAAKLSRVRPEYGHLPLGANSADQWFKLGRQRESAGMHLDALTCYRSGLEVDPNHSQLQCEIGFAYRKGWVVAQDYVEAAAWFRKAAKQGNADAQRSLGLLYHVGQGVAQDLDEAIVWYRKAAENGDEWSQCKLGLMYFDGTGASQNYPEACFWYAIAAACASNHEESTESAYWRDCVASRLNAIELLTVQIRVRNWLREHSTAQDRGALIASAEGCDKGEGHGG